MRNITSNDCPRENVAILPSTVVNAGSIKIVYLQNPRTGETAPYGVDNNNQLYELLKWNDLCMTGSWFYGETVVSDSCMWILSKIDPHFFIMSSLASEVNRTRFQDFESIFCDISQRNVLKGAQKKISIERFADVKKIERTNYFKFNVDKAHDWLEEKLKNTLKQLKNFNQDAPEEILKRSAVELICDYVCSSVEESFRGHMKVPQQQEEKMNTVPLTAGVMFGRVKENADDDAGTKAPEAKKSKLSMSQQKLLKADKSGMKSIASFFGKK